MVDFIANDEATGGLEQTSESVPYAPSGALEPAIAGLEDDALRLRTWAQRAGDVAPTDITSEGAPLYGLEMEPKVDQKELQQRFPGVKGIDEPMTLSLAQHIADDQERKQKIENATARRPGGVGNWLLTQGAEGAASLLDPVDDAAFMVPVVGESRYLSWLAGAGWAQRLGIVTGVGAARGAAGGAILAGVHRLEDPDMTLGDAAQETLSMAIGGAVLHTGGHYLHEGIGAAHDLIRDRFAQTPEGEAAQGNADLHDAALRTAAAQTANGNPVEVEPVFDAAQRARTGTPPTPEAITRAETAAQRAAGAPTQEVVRTRDEIEQAKAESPEADIEGREAEADQAIEDLRARGSLSSEDDAMLQEMEAQEEREKEPNVARETQGAAEPEPVEAPGEKPYRELTPVERAEAYPPVPPTEEEKQAALDAAMSQAEKAGALAGATDEQGEAFRVSVREHVDRAATGDVAAVGSLLQMGLRGKPMLPFLTHLGALKDKAEAEAGAEPVATEAEQPEAAAPPSPKAEPPPPQEPPPVRKPGYGESNKIVNRDAYERARARMREKASTQLNAGVDPEMLADGATMAVFHLEAGARAFHDYAKAMIEDLGEWVRPYLKSFYEAARHYPEFDSTGLTPTEEITPEAIAGAGREEQAQSESERAQMLQFSDRVAGLIGEGKKLTAKQLQEEAARIYGGTLADGTIPRDEFYDAIELGLNRYIADHPDMFSTNVDAARAAETANTLNRLKNLLPTQTVRAGEKEALQQFSTPPDYAYAAAWVGAPKAEDHVLEPSAGTGSIMVHALSAKPEKVFGNDLSERRAAMLRSLNPAEVFTENAEHVSAVLPEHVRPSLVLMNPPFSASQRMKGKKLIDVGARHVEEALDRLEPGGRLIAIAGGGMTPEKTGYKSFFAKLAKEFDLRANLGVGGSIYRKYGTTFPTRLLVIDKVAPSGRETIRAEVFSAEEIVRMLADVRNDRPAIARAEPAGAGLPETGRREPATGGENAAPGGAGTVGPREGAAAAETTGAEPAEPGSGGGAVGDAPVGGSEEGMGVAPIEPRGAEPGGAGREPVEPTGERAEPLGSGAGGAGDGVRPDGSGERLEPGLTPAPETVRATEASIEPERHEAPITDAIYEAYKPQRAHIEGAHEHPGALVQSAAMATVDPPAPKHEVAIPKALIESGALSDAQLEAIIYAGDAHSDMLPAVGDEQGRRRGFFIGDGTGVGKGREVAGIILDNWMHGRTKHVWVSEKQQLANDAKRDWKGLGRDENEILEHRKTKLGEPIKARAGVLFTTYDTLKSAETVTGETGKKTKGKNRLQQIVDWVGKDFDGVIAFDESHNLGNAIDTKGKRGLKKAAAKAIAGVELQKMVPSARVIYVSATGATEVQNLAYADRLGLWGRGTAFGDRSDFLSKVSAGGVAAMELVARDMKAMGQYIARSLSYDGVEYDRVEHVLTKPQREVYDKLADAWQLVLRNFHAAMEHAGITKTDHTGNSRTLNARAKSALLSQFWGSHQRFFNQIITSMQMPSVLKGVERDLKAGRQAVLQLVNTNEAAQERALDKARVEGEGEIEDLDMTPRDQLLQLVDRAFPTGRFEEYTDEDGRRRSRPVVDSKGDPVRDPKLLAAKESLLEELGSVRVPDGPLEMLLNHFGADKVAEVTGRKQRVVRKPDENGQMRNVVEKRPGQSNIAEASAFQSGKKKVLVFSEAGGTGRSYHAENGTDSADARRSHYLVQAGWRADKAVQGFGRTHRTNQASAPIFHLVTTDLQGQKRFISSIARRLAQLGALTKGERRTGDQGLFGLCDNLESSEATAALKQLYNDVIGAKVPSIALHDFEHQLGLRLIDPATGAKLEEMPPITQFLNRLLSLRVDTQNAVFDELSKRIDDAIERAASAGTLDSGVETYRADSIKKIGDQAVYTDPRSGAETRHVHLQVGNKIKPRSFEEVAGGRHTGGKPPLFYVRSAKSDKVFAVSASTSFTDKDGNIVEQYKLTDPVSYQFLPQLNLDNPKFWQRLPSEDAAKAAWADQVAKLPSMSKSDLHLITGAVLPIWDRLGGSPRVFRLQTDDGERMLGRVVPNDSINPTLQALGAHGVKVTATPAELAQRLDQGALLSLVNGWTVRRVNVAGERRLELFGPDFAHLQQLKSDGVFTERIDWKTRFFIPSGDKATEVLTRILADHPASDVSDSPGFVREGRRLTGHAPNGRPIYATEGRFGPKPENFHFLTEGEKGRISPLETELAAYLHEAGIGIGGNDFHPLDVARGLVSYAQERGIKSGHESFVMFDPRTRKFVGVTSRQKRQVAVDKDRETLDALLDHRARYLSVHNHPSNAAPSVSDVTTLLYAGHRALMVVGHDGSWYGLRLRDGVGRNGNVLSQALEEAAMSAEDFAARLVKPLHDKGVIPDATHVDDLYDHVRHQLLAHAGLTDYFSGYRIPDHVRDDIESAIPILANRVRQTAVDNGWQPVGPAPGDHYRPAPPVSPEEGIGELLRGIGSPARQGQPGRAAGAQAGPKLFEDSGREDAGRVAEDERPFTDEAAKAALIARQRLTAKEDIAKRAAVMARADEMYHAPAPDSLSGKGVSLADALFSQMRGISQAVHGARDSTEADTHAYQQRFVGALVSGLEKIPGAMAAWRNRSLTKEWTRELFELRRTRGGHPGITGSKLALDIAKAVHDAQTLAKFHMNRAGAWIGDYDGYVARSMHNPVKIHDAGYQAWRDFMLPLLDEDKTFGGLSADDVERFMHGSWDALSTGIHLSSADGFSKALAFNGAGSPNIARRLSQERVFHFKDADAWRAYQERFGEPNIETGVAQSLLRAGRDSALMRRWGSSPQYSFEKIIRELKEKYRSDHGAVEALKAREPKLREEFKHLTGEANIPKNDLAYKIISSGRAIEDIAKLNQVLFAHLSVFATKPHQLRFMGVGAWQRYTAAIRNLSEDKSPQGRAIMEGLYANATGQIQQMVHGYEPFADIPGSVAAVQRLVLRLGFLPQVLAKERAGTMWETANLFGQHVGKSFEELPPKVQRILSLHAISPAEWEALRSAPGHERDDGGFAYLTPRAAMRASDDSVDAIDPERVGRASARPQSLERVRRNIREDLAMKLAGLYSDAAGRSVVSPGVAERALFTRLGGQYGGPLIGQYKTWAAAAVRQMWGQAYYGMGKAEAVKALAGLAAGMTAMGALRSAINDTIAGKVPDEPNGDPKHDAALLARWIVAGGGMGIFGDYILGAMLRSQRGFDYAQNLIGGVLGPVAEDAAGVAGIAFDAAKGLTSADPGSAEAKAGDTALRDVINHLPVVNTFYVRMVLNWLFLDRLQEMSNPGYLERYQEWVKKQTGQDFYLPPATSYAGAPASP